MFIARPTALDGLICLETKGFADHRGTFVKTFQAAAFAELGMAFTPREEFYSTSHRHVVRGMHFQAPPAAHDKLVYCASGSVLDVVLDIRRSSPTYGRVCALELSATNRLSLFIPQGFAHGFLALTDGALMVYKTSTVHDPAADQGIRWNSLGFAWPLGETAPLLSKRDQEFPALADFNSPF